MKTTRTLLPFLMLLVITLSSFITKEKKYEGQVMIYGLVYINQCNSEAFEYFSYRRVDASNYYEEQKKLETFLKNKYPNAMRVRTGSSRYDFSTATNMCVIKWRGGTNNCSYDVVSVHFGTSQADAYNRAISHKNSWAGSNTSFTIMYQEYL